MRDFAIRRIEQMRDTHLMWASTREGFGMQLALLIEISTTITAAHAAAIVFEADGALVKLGGPFDTQWVNEACGRALSVLK